MHKLGFVHRRISADAIGMRLSAKQSESAQKQIYKVECLGELEHVAHLETLSQSASETPQNHAESIMAPEVASGEQHG